MDRRAPPRGAADGMTLIDELEASAQRWTVPTSAGPMVWRAWGDGPPLVLLHGASGAWSHWVRNVANLATGRRVFAPDLPGYGESGDCPEPHTAERLAAFVAEGVDAAVPAPFDMAGFSLGGVIGGIAAAALGERVRRLVLIGAGGLDLRVAETPPLVRPADRTSSDQLRAAHRENLARVMLARREAVDDLAVEVQARNVARARFRSGSIPVEGALRSALPAIRARMAAMYGALDAFCGPYLDERRALFERIQPGMEFLVVPGAGHWVNYEASQVVNATLCKLLD
jgi:pimeloyl-ACP methyl ester carboxylesterase